MPLIPISLCAPLPLKQRGILNDVKCRPCKKYYKEKKSENLQTQSKAWDTYHATAQSYNPHE